MIYTVVASGAAAASLGAAPTPVAASGCGYTVNTTVRLRSGPGTTYASWGLLRKGDVVTEPRKKHRTWWNVSPVTEPQSGLNGDTVGWVDRHYLQPSACTQLG